MKKSFTIAKYKTKIWKVNDFFQGCYFPTLSMIQKGLSVIKNPM